MQMVLSRKKEHCALQASLRECISARDRACGGGIRGLVVVMMAAAFAASSMESSIGVGQSILTAVVTMP
jgi:hypothetical protein